MIIDFHTHTFPDKIAKSTVDFLKQKSRTTPFSDGTNQALSQNGKAVGIDLSVILPVVTNPLKTEKINRSAFEINGCYDNLLSFGGIHPDTPNAKQEIKLIASLGLKGIKIHPAYQQVKLNDLKFKRIIGWAEEYGLITVTHGGIDIGIDGNWASPEMALEIIKEIKPQKFVMAHFGGWEQWQDTLKYLVGENVYFDTAFSIGSFYYHSDCPENLQKPTLDIQTAVDIIKAHGSDKILFGTDSPWGDRAHQKKIISELPVTRAEKQDILCNTAKKLLFDN